MDAAPPMNGIRLHFEVSAMRSRFQCFGLIEPVHDDRPRNPALRSIPK
jgi:hypothetical protein